MEPKGGENKLGDGTVCPVALFSSDRFLAITVNPRDFGKIRVFPSPGSGDGIKKKEE